MTNIHISIFLYYPISITIILISVTIIISLYRLYTKKQVIHQVNRKKINKIFVLILITIYIDYITITIF